MTALTKRRGRLKPAHIAALCILIAGAVALTISAHAVEARAPSSAASPAHIVLRDKDADGVGKGKLASSFENVKTPPAGGKTPDRRK